MNSGTVPKTEAQTQQEKIALEQMKSYYSTQLPALNYAIRSTRENEPAQEELAASRQAQSGRVATNQALQATEANSENRGVTGGGAFTSRIGGIMQRGASAAGEGADAARLAQQDKYYASQKGIIQAGDAMMRMADRGLVTAGGVQGQAAQAAAQATAQNQQEAASLATTVGLAFL